MMRRITQWGRQRTLRRHPLADDLWSERLQRLPALQGLNAAEQQRLRDFATLFLHEKTIQGADALQVTDEMRVTIAAWAALLILYLDPGFYRGWREILIYPDAFLAPRERRDDAGVVHLSEEPLIGESWTQGPVILSWSDAQPRSWQDGRNVVIHELAHKLDMLNGAANGMPPLHAGMVRERWTQVFSEAYQVLQARQLSAAQQIERYALESPAEFFAVLSEYFFEDPWRVRRMLPHVYEQLALFYRQDPSARRSPSGAPSLMMGTVP